MENATKALLIAAAVLIAIVLISVGISILISTSGVTDQVDSLSGTMEISIFNSQFTKYEGKQNGSNVNSLIRLVTASNAKNTKHQVTETHPSTIDVKTIYNVSMSTDENGYINKITITK